MTQKICFLITLLFFSSCGFRVIYKSDNKISDQSRAYNEELASIQVNISRRKLNQDLKNNLEKILNPDQIKVSPKYLINIDLQKDTISTFTTFTGSSGRNRVILTANYSLKDLKSGEIIATGTAIAKDDMDIENKRFAYYTAEDLISSNLTLVIARNIRDLLINDIVNSYKIREAAPKAKEEKNNFGIFREDY